MPTGPINVYSLPGFGHTRSSTPHALLSTSHCPFEFSNVLFAALPPSALFSLTHGLQRKTSPLTNITPVPETFVLLLKANPSFVVASILVAGGGVPPRTLRAPKSVCVSSLDAGPRSRDLGGSEALRFRVLWKHRWQM